MPDFLLPDLGEGLDEAEIIAWRVKPGDHVTVDQVIAEVETAKAVVEVPVPYAGVVTALHAEPGSTVSVGQPLITVDGGRAGGGLPRARRRRPRASRRPRQPEGAGGEEASGSVLIGYGTTASAGPQAARPPPGAGSARARPHAAGRPAMPAAPPPAVPAPSSSAGTPDRPRGSR